MPKNKMHAWLIPSLLVITHNRKQKKMLLAISCIDYSELEITRISQKFSTIITLTLFCYCTLSDLKKLSSLNFDSNLILGLHSTRRLSTVFYTKVLKYHIKGPPIQTLHLSI